VLKPKSFDWSLQDHQKRFDIELDRRIQMYRQQQIGKLVVDVQVLDFLLFTPVAR